MCIFFIHPLGHRAGSCDIVYLYFGFTGVTAQTILIAYSVPTGINTALIALEYDNNQNYAIQAVVASTIFSIITLTFVVYIAGILYPV